MVRKRNPGTFPIRIALGHTNAIQDFLCISTVVRYQSGCTPRIEADHIIDSSVKVIRFFQH